MRYLLLPLLVVVLDTICIISAAFFSIYIRFEDTAIAQKYLEMLISQLPIAVAVHLVVYFVFKLYGRVWRYAGSIELVAIVAANIVAALSWYGISIYIDLALPRSLYIFTASILVLFVGGKTSCKLTILPGVYEIIEGSVSVSQLRPVDVEDLLGRDPVELDNVAVAKYLSGKTVLITGAGGSIGSEIVRQVAKMYPNKLLLVGKGENSIYEIMQDMNLEYPQLKKVPIIADVRDEERINAIMDYFKPQVVFHAAAHKHVPLMEYQPSEAVRNNILGTKVIAETAAKHKVETFVMISTDKAVNPTSVMGCTKRIAEMFVQSMNKESSTRFVAVRFGNVLGSRGSVIPLFKKQIAKGGPVTVTDAEMKRYFMTIPEASQLVLQAGAMAKGGEVFVLDMGKPVRIYDLAKDLIKLSGFIPDKDIEIKITGLRPGEKLFEELLSAEDGTEKTTHSKIFIAKIKDVDKAELQRQIVDILQITEGDAVVRKLQEIVPTYTPNRDALKK